MKKKLLFTKQLKTLFTLLVFSICFNFGWSQTNLVLNGTCQEHTGDNNDNADSWDMTPNSKIKDNSGTDIDSPYKALWFNQDLADWLETECGDGDEQPGSSSDGNWTNGEKTRGVKLNEACRRLYQVIAVTPNTEYTFSLESRSEAENTPAEIFILNTEIVDEVGLDGNSASVDHYYEITNDFNASKSNETDNNFTTTTFNFTASTSKIVIYVRSTQSTDSTKEVFFDNISLVVSETASVEDVFAANFSIAPNPAKDLLNISSKSAIDSAKVIDITGRVVLSEVNLNNNTLNVSSLEKGIYILQLTSGNITGTTKIIKE